MSAARTFADHAVTGGVSNLQALISSGADINERDSKGRTALFRTCRLGQLEKVLILIAAGADPNAVDDTGEAPLQTAARYGHLECLEALIEAGADVNYCPPPSLTAFSETALCSAARKFPEAARLLLAHGADPNVATDARRYPLLTAIEWGHSELVPLLLQHQASVLACTQDGRTALHAAVQHGDESSVRELLKADADKNARDARGETPIYCGVQSGIKALPAILQLLDADPDLAIPSSYWDMTPLERAIRIGAVGIAEVLRNAGSPPPREPDELSRDDDGRIVITVDVNYLLEQLESGEIEEAEPDWRHPTEPVDKQALEATDQERDWARQAERELPSLVSVIGYRGSKPHWELLRHAEQPMPMTRLAYFARGYLNAPAGLELEDGMKVLGETYESAVERFVTLGLLRRVEGPRAIQQAFTQAELIARAKQKQIKATGLKPELAARLFEALGDEAFAERLRSHGGYFELTPAGVEEARGFQVNHGELDLEKRREVVEALMEHDFLRAVKGVRALTLMKKRGPWDEPRIDARSIAHARFIRECQMPQKLRFIAGFESRYMSIAAAHVMLDALGDDWHSWDPSMKAPETNKGDPVRLHVFCAALIGLIV